MDQAELYASFEARLPRTALIVAHPDDEILWFSSILHRVHRVIICYEAVIGQPTWSKGRAEARERFPLDNAKFLCLTEAETFGGVNWSDPQEIPEGLATEPGPTTSVHFSVERYRDNYQLLVDKLAEELKDVDQVVTHNPWGEYGHEDHVQVYRAARTIAIQRKLPLWFTTYCSDRSAALMHRHIGGYRGQVLALKTQPAAVAEIEALYRETGCWTWPFDDFEYFAHDFFVADLEQDHTVRGSTLPLNYIYLIDPKRRPQDDSLRSQLRNTLRALARSARRWQR